MKVFLNGVFIEEDKAGLPVTDRGFTLGDGVFDTMRAINGSLADADLHFERLLDHAAVLKIPVGMSVEDFKDAAHHLITPSSRHPLAIRTAISRGPGERGLAPPEAPQPTILMRASPAPAPVKPPRLIIAQNVRRNEHSPLCRIKSSNYGDNILALMEAKERGADDALMLNNAGHVACSTASNIFVQIGGVLYTPPLSDGVMNGITRQKLLPRAREKSLSTDDLMRAEAIYLTSSIMGIRPAESINGVKLKSLTALAA